MTLDWPGKNRARPDHVAPDDLCLVERYDPQRLTAQGSLSLDAPREHGAWRNRLVLGDNVLTMHALMSELRGQIDLIYIDPPFATGLSYYSQTGRGDASLEHRAYRDNLGGGMAGYADAMFERLENMHALLADDGKIFVHCDWRASAVLRLTLDELFGEECFRNEIIWRRAPNLGRQAASKQLGRVFDSIFVYGRTVGAKFAGKVPRRRTEVVLDGKGKPKGARWDEERELYFTTAPRGDYTDKSIAKLRAKGRVYDSSAGKVYIKYFLTKGDDGRWYKEQPVDALWDDYDVRPLRHRPKAEVMGYDTQKPEGLLERIISWATQPGDLVADFFCGSGTTLAVAQQLGRRWIGCDRQRPAIEITRRRLGALGASFDVFSAMRGERRRWAEAVDNDAAAVLSAFDADPQAGRWGQKQGVRVWVAPLHGAVDEAAIDAACVETGGGKLVVLAWEWGADDARSLRERMQAQHGVELEMRTIPLDVMRLGGTPSFLMRPEVDLTVVDGSVHIRDVRLDAPSRLRENKSNKSKGDDKALGWADYLESWRIAPAGETFSPTWQGVRDGDGLVLTSPSLDGVSRAVHVKLFTVFGDVIDRVMPC